MSDDDDCNTVINWINDLQNNKEEQSLFYKTPVTKVTICCLFINTVNEITSAKKNSFTLKQSNILSKYEILYIISHSKPKHYSLLDILVYQMTLTSNDLSEISYYNGLRSQTDIQDIVLEDVLDYFQDMNTIYFLFHEKKNTNASTRRVHFSIDSKKKKYSRRNSTYL